MNNIPRAFCITLKETQLRTNGFLELSKNAGLNVELFYGILGNRLGLSPKFTNEIERPGKNISLNDQAIGCTLSHFTLWNLLKYLPEDEFLIFEDDAVINPDFVDKFTELYNKLPLDWEMVYVGWVPNGNDVHTIIVNDGISIRTVSATHAYLIKKTIINKLCDCVLPIQSPLDLTIINKVLPLIKYYVFDPCLVEQRSYLNSTDPIWASLIYDWKNDLYEQKQKILNELSLNDDEWYMVESNGDERWKWSKDKFTIKIPKLINSLQLFCSVPLENVLTITCGDQTKDYNMVGGEDVIYIKLNGNADTIEGKMKFPYIPSQNDSNTTDDRTLGICLRQIVIGVGSVNIPLEVVDI
jgi:GR25 family glycosyltransferase involved in LPS biosynthesis